MYDVTNFLARCERDVTSETETAILENISKCLEYVFTKQLSVESVQTFKLTVRLVLYLISLELAYFQKYTYMFRLVSVCFRSCNKRANLFIA